MSEAQALLDQFMAARRADDLEQGTALVTKALEVARASGDGPDLARTLKAEAQLYRDTDRAESAIAPYVEAVALCRSAGGPHALAHTIRHLGDVLFDLGRLDEADECLTEAVDLYRSQAGAEDMDIANAVRPLAALREAQGRLQEAVVLWTEARDGYAAVGIDAGVQEAEVHLTRLRSP